MLRGYILIFLISFCSFQSHAITLSEGVAKCKGMTKEERKKSSLCKKVVAKLKEKKQNKLNRQPAKKVDTAASTPSKDTTKSGSDQLPLKNKSEMTYEKMAKTKAKCEKLPPPKQYQHKVCHEFMSQSNDPFLGKEKKVKPQYAVSLGYSLLGDITGVDLEVLRRTQNWSLGIFVSPQTISDLASNEVEGLTYGLSVHYHLTPLYYTKKNHLDFNAFSQIGLTDYESSSQGALPNYFYLNLGLESSIPLTKINTMTLRGYGKISLAHIYHSESDFLSLGGSGTVGLKLEF